MKAVLRNVVLAAILLTPVARPAQARAQAQPQSQSLADYYEAADEVVLARLEATVARGTVRIFQMTIVEAPWRSADTRAEPLREGDVAEYFSSIVPQECSIPPLPGGVFVVFATPGPEETETFGTSACAGTRLYLSDPTAQPQGFDDVPGNFVISQLDALSGMDVIREFTAADPDPTDAENTSLVGMLELEGIPPLGPAPDGAPAATVSVREQPAANAPVLATVTSYNDLESREVGYELGAATAFARVDGWTRVRLPDGRYGWVGPDDSGTWHPYGELVVNRLNYLTDAWSGHVWPEPGAGIPARSSLKSTQDREEYAAEVLESMNLAGTLWFRVNVLVSSPCESGESRTSLSGWIPAYGPSGDPTAWFYSRAC